VPRIETPPGRASLRVAFTVVELLVVIAIIGLLVGLLLPAVQTAREAGRRAACTTRIKQLALGMLNFVDVRGRFPANYGDLSTNMDKGVWPSHGANSLGRTWISEILPFVERNDLAAGISFTAQFQNNSAFRQALPEARCPSDSGPSLRTDNLYYQSGPTASGAFGITNYKSVAGGNWAAPPFQIYFRCGGSRNCVDGSGKVDGSTGWSGEFTGNGVACRNTYNRSTNLTYLKSVTDGLSKTLAIGETVPDWCGYSMWGYFTGAHATTGYPLNYGIEKGDAALVAARSTAWSAFASRHPGGAAFALCDGSVAFIADSIDTALYSALGAINGGSDSGAGLPAGIASRKGVP